MDSVALDEDSGSLLLATNQTAQTPVAVYAILNQTDVVCVYVAIGHKTSWLGYGLNLLHQLVKRIREMYSILERGAKLADVLGGVVADHQLFFSEPHFNEACCWTAEAPVSPVQ